MKPIMFRLQRTHSLFRRSDIGAGGESVCRPTPPMYVRVFGVTRDSTGAAIGVCAVELYRTSDDVVLDRTISDASGNYEFRTGSSGDNRHYVRAYKAGSPDLAGTTVDTLIGVA